MNSAQPLTNPMSLESGTYSPNGTRWILSYLPMIPRSVTRNAALVRRLGGASSTSMDPMRSAACSSPDSAVSMASRAGSRRSAVGDAVSGRYPRVFCGGGDLAACRQALLGALGSAVAQPATTTYPGDSFCAAGNQWCADAIAQLPLGGITDPLISWQNRPTYQQVVSFPAHR